MRTLAPLLVLGAAVFGAPVVAQAAEPVTAHVTASTVKGCNTDGGNVKCSVGAQTIAKGLRFGLEDPAVACPGVKPGRYTLALVYEYNDGTVSYASHQLARTHGEDSAVATTPLTDETTLTDLQGKPLKKLPNLPACVREELLPRAGALILTYLQAIRPIDPEADVRATYQLQVKIE